jgi:hypothetical protein
MAPPEGPAILATVADPDGRPVVLTAAGWRHILTQHREMAPHRDAVLQTVAAPDHRRPDPRPGRERFYRRGAGPSRWCFVVVDFTVAPARIVTALGTRRDPPGWPRPEGI